MAAMELHEALARISLIREHMARTEVFRGFRSLTVGFSGVLPGLWASLFSMGVFATYRLLPRSIFWVAVYYLACAVVILCLGPAYALSPWTMAGTFGVGQLLAAVLLYLNLERRDDEPPT